MAGNLKGKYKFLILGGGYAGVPIAYRLMQQGEDFLVLNNRPYQTLTALLPELVTGNIKDQDGILWLNTLFPNFFCARVEEHRPEDSYVVAKDPRGEQVKIEYDYCVVCLGWEPNIFLPQKGVYVVCDYPSALEVRKRLFDHVEKVVVCGAGFVGVETAGQIGRLSHRVGMDVILVEGADEILPTLPDDARQEARKVLDDMGVRVITGKAVKSIVDGMVLFEDSQSIRSDLAIWAMGVRASRLVEKSGFTTDPLGRAKVDEYLRSIDYPNCFFAGDCAGTDQQMLGQIAVQQGKFLGTNLSRLVKGEKVKVPEFQYKGLTVKVGDRAAVAAIGETITFSGLLAVWLKKMIGKKYFLDIRL